MRWALVIALCSAGLGACSLLVDTSGLSEPGAGTVSDGAAGDRAAGDGATSDGATSDGAVSDAAADAVSTDAARDADAAACVKSGGGCSSNQECCSMKCGAFPFIFCQ